MLGVVLAGGRSRRFGSDKAAALLDARSLLEHAVASLTPHVREIVVAGRSDPRWCSVDDAPQPGLGPLGGICGALRHARVRGHAAILCVPCDMPRLPPGLLALLAHANGAAYTAQAPVIARWPVTELDRLEEHMAADGDRALTRWARSIGAQAIAWPEPLANINRPADLAALS
nr:molybdenum cofactor guanylyltransferase [Sphingomonas japonica]